MRLGLLKTDPLLQRFVLTRCLLLCTALSAPFYVSLAQAALGSPALLLGAFIVASGLASLVSAPFWGRLADRSSRHVMMLGAVLAAGTGLTVFAIDALHGAWFESPWLLPVLYFVLAIAHQGARIGRKTYVVDIAAGGQRTDYVAVSNTAVGLVLLGAGALGAVGAAFSTPLVILALSLLGLTGTWLAHRLPEAERADDADAGDGSAAHRTFDDGHRRNG
jgi:MFS family permease